MSQTFNDGTYKTFTTPEGQDVPFYILRFDKHGALLSEKAKNEILQRVGEYTDIFFFSHGWNNDWTVAREHYDEFFEQYLSLRTKHNLAMPEHYKPLMVGVFWPSTALVFGERERGPQGFMKTTARPKENLDTHFQEDLEAVAELFSEKDRQELYSLVQDGAFSSDSERRLAELAAKISSDDAGELPSTGQADIDEILRGWKEASMATQSLDGEEGFNASDLNPGLKGIFPSILDPRRIIRLLTVVSMKDRAGVVGHAGVGAMLQALLDQSTARIHLIGHSYGTKVMLSALKSTRPTSRKVHSALLLQPAISHLAFADSIPRRKRAGAYHDLLERVDAPILSTYSKNDIPLYWIYQRVLRRNADVGEGLKATFKQPSLYAALGGYGPRASRYTLIPLQQAPSPYSLNDNTRIYGLDGSDKMINDHGDVRTEHTAWALYALVSYKMPG